MLIFESKNEKEIIYFKNYKKLLNDYLTEESMNVTVIQYMKIVDEIKRIETYIKKLKKVEICIIHRLKVLTN